MYMQQHTLDTVANNMANAKTPGFKAERVVSTTFEQELMMRQERGNTRQIGSNAPVRVISSVPSELDPSLLEDTGRVFDMAINGYGYFNVKSEDGETYMTRNGGFDLDEEGYLVLNGVGRVMGQKGEIKLGTAYFTVDADGVIVDGQGKRIDSLLVTMPNEGTNLLKYPNGMFRIDENPPQQDANGQELNAAPAVTPGVTNVANPNIRQMVLEGSNIDLNREMSLLMETQRNFTSCSKMLQMIDQVNQKTVAIAGQ